MKKIVHRSEERGMANHGWLKAKHSFSFAQWYNPEKIQFGALRVLNDDEIAPAAGFGTHPHDNMEIITIPWEGKVRHEDSIGHTGEITAGEIQVMSAGSGIMHSEFNGSPTETLKLFQIWIMPNQRNVEPRYDQFTIATENAQNNFLQLVSPNKDDEGSWIHQDAWIHLADVDENEEIDYTLKNSNNGIYVMNVNGNVDVADESLSERDAIGIWDTEKVTFFAKQKSRILVLEVPM